MSVGEWLQKVRSERGLTQNDVASQMRKADPEAGSETYDQGTISRLESRDSRKPLDLQAVPTLEALARAYKVVPEEEWLEYRRYLTRLRFEEGMSEDLIDLLDIETLLKVQRERRRQKGGLAS